LARSLYITLAQEGLGLKRESAEIYADFTISRISPTVRAELTQQQLAEIRRALVAPDTLYQHSLDLRVTVPLYYRRYYFVLFGGRDRRRSTLSLELYRLNRYPKWLKRSLYFAATGAVVVTGILGLLAVLYLIKSFAGLDLFPNFHLSDILPFDLYGTAQELLKAEK